MSQSSPSNQQPQHKPWMSRAAILGASVLVAGTSLALTTPDNHNNSKSSDTAPAAQPEVKVDHATVDRGRVPAGSFAPIVKKVAPSVVEVFVTSKTPRGQLSGMNGPNGMDAFRRFFGQGGGQFGDDSEGDTPRSPARTRPRVGRHRFDRRLHPDEQPRRQRCQRNPRGALPTGANSPARLSAPTQKQM